MAGTLAGSVPKHNHNPMIKNLIFDFGKVLVDYDFEAFFRHYIPDTARRRAFTPVLYNEEVQHLLDREEQPFDNIIEDLVRKHPAFEPEIRIFQQHYCELVTYEVAGMRELLARLRQEGYRLYGLTNWCRKVYHTMEQYGIFRLLDGQVISSEEHIIKPEPGIYHTLFNRFGLVPEECVFTDDRPENIEAGRALGMEGIVFRHTAQYERELRDIIAARRHICDINKESDGQPAG